jgi:hypothetical protein
VKLGFLFRIVLSRHWWKRYALALEAQLEGEKARNQEREDTLLNIVPHALGVFGPRVRDGRAQPLAPLRRQINQRKSPVDPWQLLTEEERAEWPTYLADADPDGVNVPAVRREFLQMIQTRRQEEGVEIM